MFYKPTSRIIAIKFLGLFGTAAKSSTPDQESNDDNSIKYRVTTVEQPPCNPKSKSDQSQLKEAIETSNRKVLGLYLKEGLPGLTICVSRKGQVVWHTAYGFCDVENQLECRPEARMRIASISKALFASTIVGPLMDEKNIDLKSSVHKYLSEEEFPRQKYNDKEVDITIEQLLSHTSGVKHYIESFVDDDVLRPIASASGGKIFQGSDQYNHDGFFQRKRFRSVVDALEPFKHKPLVSEPGSAYNYTTYGYTLLSAVLEKIYLQLGKLDKKNKNETKQIEDFWMEILRRDWNMNETSLDLDEPILENRSRYYMRSGKHGKLINAPYADNSVKWAGGGIVSTTYDLVKFGNALIDSYKSRSNAKLKSETMKQLWTELKGHYGLGFRIMKLNPDGKSSDKRAVVHSGGALGASSVLVLYPDSEVVVAILVNLGEVNLMQLGLYVAEQFATVQ